MPVEAGERAVVRVLVQVQLGADRQSPVLQFALPDLEALAEWVLASVGQVAELEHSEPVRVLTAGFPDAVVHDERDHARAVARTVGAEHIQVAFTEDDFWTLLPVVTNWPSR